METPNLQTLGMKSLWLRNLIDWSKLLAKSGWSVVFTSHIDFLLCSENSWESGNPGRCFKPPESFCSGVRQRLCEIFAYSGLIVETVICFHFFNAESQLKLLSIVKMQSSVCWLTKRSCKCTRPMGKQLNSPFLAAVLGLHRFLQDQTL